MIGIKYALFLLSIFIFSFAVSAQFEDYALSNTLDLEVKVSAEIFAVPEKESSSINYLKADLRHFPESTFRQQVLDSFIESSPKAEIKNNPSSLVFTWIEPTENHFSYSINSQVRTQRIFPEIKEKISFPLKRIPQEYFEFTRATEFIDINPAIESKAREIVSNEDDLYFVLFRLADWTKNNIKYDLNTLTADVVEKSSWVLENRQGVCDEITNLFISFARSLGIPARFVSGIVYSSTDGKFSNHGWAEVYFPDYGWIPFDVTFGEYGRLNPTHVRLKADADSGNPSVFYSWAADGIEMDVKKLDVTAKVLRKSEPAETKVMFSIYTLEKEVGFGSYVPLVIEAINTKNYYVSPQLIVTKAPGLVEKNVKEFLLKPNEKRTFYWTLKIPSNLDRNKIYTAEIEVRNAFNITDTTTIIFNSAGKIITKEEAEKMIAKLSVREYKKDLDSLTFDCNLDKPFYYQNENALVSCSLSSTENLDSFSFCIAENCKQLSIVEDEKKALEFNILALSPGRLSIHAETEEAIIYDYLDINVVNIPRLSFSEISPEIIDYKEKKQLRFTVTSETPVYNVVLDFGKGKMLLEELEGSQEVILSVKGIQMLRGIPVEISYEDSEGKTYSLEKTFFVEVTNVPWYARLLSYIGLI